VLLAATQDAADAEQATRAPGALDEPDLRVRTVVLCDVATISALPVARRDEEIMRIVGEVG